MPIVSIIVPIYNAEKYLDRCISSLLSQDYRDFELLLVNDGSTDLSGKICDEYAAKDNRIKVFHKTSGGVSSARNLGLDNAQGKYIMFCDADDSVYPDFCQSLIEASQDDENCLTLAGITKIHHNGLKTDSICPKFGFGEKIKLTKQEFCDLYVDLNLNSEFHLITMSYNKLLSRKIIEDNRLRFDTSLNYCEDVFFSLAYFDHIDTIRFFNKPIYFYSLYTPGSLCKRYIHNAEHIFKEKEKRLKESIYSLASNKDLAHRLWCNTVIDDTQRAISNTLSPINPQSKKEKHLICNKLIRNKDFRTALKGADKKRYNPLYISIMKLGSFHLYRILLKIKNK